MSNLDSIKKLLMSKQVTNQYPTIDEMPMLFGQQMEEAIRENIFTPDELKYYGVLVEEMIENCMVYQDVIRKLTDNR